MIATENAGNAKTGKIKKALYNRVFFALYVFLAANRIYSPVSSSVSLAMFSIRPSMTDMPAVIP